MAKDLKDSPLYLFESAYEKDPNSKFVKSVERFYLDKGFLAKKQKEALKNVKPPRLPRMRGNLYSSRSLGWTCGYSYHQGMDAIH